MCVTAIQATYSGKYLTTPLPQECNETIILLASMDKHGSLLMPSSLNM